MNRRIRQLRGMTLTEVLVTMAIISILFAIGVPAARKIMSAFDSSSNVRRVISAALNNARAIAMSEQTLAGVRFQEDRDGTQCMVLIQYARSLDPTALADGFVAVAGRTPVKLPTDVLLIDPTVVERDCPSGAYTVDVTGEYRVMDYASDAARDGRIDEFYELTDSKTFSVVFDKSGRLVTERIRVRNAQGYSDTATNTETSTDPIFNKKAVVDAGGARFYQDDYFGAWWSPYDPGSRGIGLGPEYSRHRFLIVSREELAATPAAQRWTQYLRYQPWACVNPYSGEVVITESPAEPIQ